MTDIIAGVGLLQLLLVGAVVVLAAILRAFTGFGFGLAAVPVFALLMPPTEAVVLSSSLTLTVSLLTLKTYWGGVSLRPLLPMLVLAVFGTVLGVVLLESVNPQQFKLWIGVLVILACIVLGFYRPGHHEPGVALGGFTGLCSGVMNGAFAIPGPPVILYVMATETDAARSRALLLMFFLFMAGVALVIYAFAGFVTPAAPLQYLLAMPAMFVGDKLGYWLFRQYGTALYRRVALTLLLAVGVAITVEALW